MPSAKRDETIQILMNETRERIQYLREKSDMTQEQLAKRAGWTQSNLSKFLRGSIVPGLDKLFGLQYALGLDSLEDLVAALPAAPTPRTGELLAAARAQEEEVG
jgi:transcriptional regulator with XRE-family HTH domain